MADAARGDAYQDLARARPRIAQLRDLERRPVPGRRQLASCVPSSMTVFLQVLVDQRGRNEIFKTDAVCATIAAKVACSMQ
jgi:hypothetical protein